MNISRWQVKRVFAPNTILYANLAPAGNGIITDNYGQPWLKIRLDSEDGSAICLIRAHRQYIKPVITSFDDAVYWQNCDRILRRFIITAK